jgi:hypothetical protein
MQADLPQADDGLAGAKVFSPIVKHTDAINAPNPSNQAFPMGPHRFCCASMTGLIQQNLSEPPQGSARAMTTRPRSWEAEGKQLIQAGRFEQALTLFRKVKEKNPKDPRPYFYSGLALMESANLTGQRRNWTKQ